MGRIFNVDWWPLTCVKQLDILLHALTEDTSTETLTGEGD